MTEAEWLASDDPDSLMDYICERRRIALGITQYEAIVDEERRGELPAGVYPRQRRLFACACCRRIWPLLSEVARQAVDVAERYADGHADESERRSAIAAVQQEGRTYWDLFPEPSAHSAGSFDALKAAGAAALAFTDDVLCVQTLWIGPGHRPFLDCDQDDGGFTRPANDALRALVVHEGDPEIVPFLMRWNRLRRKFVDQAGPPTEGKRWYAELVAQCDLLRDIFGNSFRPVELVPSPGRWQSLLRLMKTLPESTRPDWLTRTVQEFAESIYADRAFDRLPILADALEEAGCTNADILGHCRGPGPHVRGCWVVDLLLGKS